MLMQTNVQPIIFIILLNDKFSSNLIRFMKTNIQYPKL